MSISIVKTECMTFSKEPLRYKIVVYDQIFEQVIKFRYLGVDIFDRAHQVTGQQCNIWLSEK